MEKEQNDYLGDLGSEIMKLPKCVRSSLWCNLGQYHNYPEEVIKEKLKIGGINEDEVFSIMKKIDNLSDSKKEELRKILDENDDAEIIYIKDCVGNATLWTDELLILKDEDGKGYKITSHSDEDDCHREINLNTCEEILNSYLKKMLAIKVGNKYKLYYEYDEEVKYDDIFEIKSITVKMEKGPNEYFYPEFIIETDKGEINEEYFSNYVYEHASISPTICSCEKVE